MQQQIFLDTAWNIGTSLMKHSIWHAGKKCNWTGTWIDYTEGSYRPVVKSFGPDLYGGTAGIALFLAALYTQTNDALLKQTIEGTVAQIKDTVHTAGDHGFYSGKPGIAAALISAGRFMEREDWINDGVQLLDTITIGAIGPNETDLISGIAGSIPLLLEAYAQYARPALLDKAIRMGHILCEQATKEHQQWSWHTVPGDKNLTGFSHGVSGISSALLALHAITNEPLFLQAAMFGFNYEQQHFDAGTNNWPDFRTINTTTGKHDCGYAWCHGAPGIALSRLKTNVVMPHAHFESESATALQTTAKYVTETLQQNFGNANYSLCHGLAGNADILLESDNAHHKKLAEAVGIAGIHHYQQNNTSWPSGLAGKQHTPGLMMGIAGTGYFYLRLYDPAKLKTVLLPQLFAA